MTWEKNFVEKAFSRVTKFGACDVAQIGRRQNDVLRQYAEDTQVYEWLFGSITEN